MGSYENNSLESNPSHGYELHFSSKKMFKQMGNFEQGDPSFKKKPNK